MSSSGIDDSTIHALASLTILRRLDLSSTEITNAAIDQLANLKNLNSLNLSDTEISDAGLQKLSKIILSRSLIVGLNRTKVTAKGIVEAAFGSNVVLYVDIGQFSFDEMKVLRSNLDANIHESPFSQ